MKLKDFLPATDLENFLNEHGESSVYHPDFLSQFKASEIYVLGTGQRLPTGQLAIALDVDEKNSKPTLYAYTSRLALEYSLKRSSQATAKFAALPGEDVLKMIEQKARICLNSNLDHQIVFENSGG